MVYGWHLISPGVLLKAVSLLGPCSSAVVLAKSSDGTGDGFLSAIKAQNNEEHAYTHMYVHNTQLLQLLAFDVACLMPCAGRLLPTRPPARLLASLDAEARQGQLPHPGYRGRSAVQAPSLSSPCLLCLLACPGLLAAPPLNHRLPLGSTLTPYMSGLNDLQPSSKSLFMKIFYLVYSILCL